MGSFFHGLSWVFPRLLDHSVEISVLICLIFLVKILASKKLPPWWHYSLWLLLLVRMLVPLEFENRLSLFAFVPSVETPHVSGLISAPPPEMEIPVHQAVSKAEIAEADLRFAVTKSIPVVWLTGAMILGVCILFESISFWRIVRRKPKVTDGPILALLSECKSRMKIKRKIDIVVTDNIRSPALFGYLRPRLLLPEGIFEKLSDKELSFAFMHELGHLKRHDIGVSWLVAVLQVIHWFNPLVWLAFYQIRIDQESACDAAVLKCIEPRQSADYAKAIVGFLEKFCHNCQLPALAGVLENRSQMKKRIARIVQYRKSSHKFSVVAFALLAIAGFVLFTLTGVAAEKESFSYLEPVVENPEADLLPLITESRPTGNWNASDGFRDDAVPADFDMAPENMAGSGGPRDNSEMPLYAFSESASQNETFFQNRSDLNIEDVEGEVQPVSLTRLADAESEPVSNDSSVSSEKSTPKQTVKTGANEIPKTVAEDMQANPQKAAAQSATVQNQPRKEDAPVSTLAMNSEDGPAADFIVELGPAPGFEADFDLQPSISAVKNNKDNVPVEQDYAEAESVGLDQYTVSAEIEMLKETGKTLLQNKSTKASMMASAKREESVVAGAFRAADVDTPPQVIKKYPPRYPYLAKRDDISGTIMLQFVVTEDGNAVDTKVVASEPKGIFDESALQAIEQYRFKPGIKDGEAVPVRVNLPFKFDLT